MTGIEPALSAWELACHASMTSIIRINRSKLVHATDRQIPPLCVRSGTWRARALPARCVLITCLQSTFTLSIIVDGLGIGLAFVRSSRLFSGPVVVRCRGQLAHDRLLRKSSRNGWPTAGFLVRAGFLVVRILPDVRSFRLVLVHEWQDQLGRTVMAPLGTRRARTKFRKYEVHCLN
jgi:hypothetical protein